MTMRLICDVWNCYRYRGTSWMGNTPAKENSDPGNGRNLRKSRSQEVNGTSKKFNRSATEFSSFAEKENEAVEEGPTKPPPTRKASAALTKIVGTQSRTSSISKKSPTENNPPVAGSVRLGQRNSTSSSKRESMSRKSENPAKRTDSAKLFSKDHAELSQSDRDMISFCLDNAKHGDLGVRIYLRVFEKRPDLNGMFEMLGKDLWVEQGKEFTGFLSRVVKKLDYPEVVENLCKEFGAKHVDLRAFGFKPDFWVTMADAMTTECLYLDEGVHPPADVIASWGALISLLFGHMRDGYYDRLRRERKLSKKLTRQSTTRSYTSSEAPSEENFSETDSRVTGSEPMAVRPSLSTDSEADIRMQSQASPARGSIILKREEEPPLVNQQIPEEPAFENSTPRPVHFFVPRPEKAAGNCDEINQ